MSLTNDELYNINGLFSKLTSHDYKNNEKEKYYEGKNRVTSLGIAIPPSLSTVQNIVGWAGTVVNVIEERLDFKGYTDAGNYGVQDIFRANDLGVEASQAHRDALIYGVSYVAVGKGIPENGEPETLITIESPKKFTSSYDLRKRRLTSALSVNRDDHGNPISGALYLENETIYLECINGRWIDIYRDVHNLGRLPIARLVNNPRTGEINGSSEITPAIMGNIKEASRSLLHMSVSSEFYSAPQRYILGASSEAFTDADGNPIDSWSAIIGRLQVLSRDEEGNMPSVGEFSAATPQPFIDQVKLYAELVAANAGIPANYFGFNNQANPTSADALRVMETRLIKTAERKQASYARGWLEVARLALLIRDGEVPANFTNDVSVNWGNPAQITQAAAADAATKLISAGVLLPDSEVTYDELGFTDSQKVTLRQEKSEADAQLLVANLAQASSTVVNNLNQA